MALFHIRDLSFTYPGGAEPSLRHVELTIEQGEFILFCGKSGSGKTTLLRHLKSVLAPYGHVTGEVLFDGTPLCRIPARDQAARIGFVMQNPDDQIVTDKVWHELAFGLENLGTDPQTMRSRVAEMASYFGIQGWFQREIRELSGGQKQLLNLASVMAMQPDVLVLDEPTSQLDPIAASDFLNTLQKINRELGTTILITEHRLEDVFPAADRVVVMDGGAVCVCDTPRKTAQALCMQKHEMRYALPSPVRIFYETEGGGECPLTVREGRNWLARSLPEEKRIRELPASKPFRNDGAALTIRDGWFRYERNGMDVLKGLSLSVPQGSFFAVVGGNGTGKSTALKAVCGICRLYRGNVTLFGKKLKDYRPGELFRSCVSMLPQDPKSLFVCGTVGEELAEMGAKPEEMDRIARLCEITSLLSAHPYDLSGGEIQRAALAKVLLTHPRLILLDEPTKGLDSFFKQKLAGILKKLCDAGTTVLMVSHDVEFCAEYADFTGMFFDGQLLSVQEPKRFFGANSFYTTAANRMSRSVFVNAVTVSDVAELYRQNQERFV